VAFERRDDSDWTFFTFLLYLLIPIVTFLLGCVILPEFDDDAPDLASRSTTTAAGSPDCSPPCRSSA
jgi:hypothetical protein